MTLHKLRIALTATLVALAAVSTIDTASAFPRGFDLQDQSGFDIAGP
jgi:hypothetical protein